MKFTIIMLIISATMASATTEGLSAVLARRKTMQRIERPVAQRIENGHIMSVYEDGRVEKSAVRLVSMPDAAQARVEALRDDQATLAAARAMAARVRAANPNAASSLPDAALLGAAEEILDTSARDGSVGFGLGAALGAAAAAAAAAKNHKA